MSEQIADDVNQRAFDVVARHLLKQGHKSEDVDGGCVYRGTGGDKCAAGALIDDAHYSRNFEGKNVGVADVFDAIESSGYRGVLPLLCERLQELHDDVEPELWAPRLAFIAEAFALSPAVLAEFPQ